MSINDLFIAKITWQEQLAVLTEKLESEGKSKEEIAKNESVAEVLHLIDMFTRALMLKIDDEMGKDPLFVEKIKE